MTNNPESIRGLKPDGKVFGWLEHYAGLHRHLCAISRCVMRNERLVVFDLRAAP